MSIHQARLQVAVTVVLTFTLVCLSGCGSGGSTGSGITVANPSLAIADSGNNRVLVYNSPLSKTEGAAVVLGQTDFTHESANRGTEHPAANTFNIPGSVARDSAGNLYVADAGNARVLIFHPPFTTGMNASVVIGQTGFTSVNVQHTASGMGTSYNLAIDNNGNLWVADETNDRVMEYQPPFSNGMAASVAIGQTSTSVAAPCYLNPPTASTLCYPVGIAFDAKGNLWLADPNYNRVLEYTPPFSTGMAASLELGQPAATAFTSESSNGPSAASVAAPSGIAFDSSGNLWLADFGFNRVLEYAPPFTNGMAATSVLGQPDFTHGDPNQNAGSPSAGTLSNPETLAFDSAGNLNVVDRFNSRILIFPLPLTQGMNASTVVGQTNFTTGSINGGSNIPTANTLSEPFSLSAF